MLDGLDREVHIEVGPVQMVGMGQLDVQQLSHRNILEPREILEGQEQFPALDQEPESMLRNVRDLNVQGGPVTRWEHQLPAHPVQA